MRCAQREFQRAPHFAGLKQLESNPWERLHEKYPIGSTVEGRVRNLTDFGAFIEIEDGIDGLVHVSNLSWTKRVKHPSEVLKKGEKVKAIVLGIEPEQRRLSLGVKQLQPDAWESFFQTHRIGDVVHGKVLRLAQFGAFVEIAEGVEGLCHNSEATDSTGAGVKLDAGQEHDFKIIKMNPEEKKVGLSLRAVGAKPAAPMWKRTSILLRAPPLPPRWATSSTGSAPATIRTNARSRNENKKAVPNRDGLYFPRKNYLPLIFKRDVDLLAAVKSAQCFGVTARAFMLRIDLVIDVGASPENRKCRPVR